MKISSNFSNQHHPLNAEIYGNIFGSINIPFLNYSFDVNSQFENHFHSFVEFQKKILLNGPENCFEEAKSLLKNLVKAKSCDYSVKEKNRIDFLIYHFGVSLIELFNMTGHFHYCYEIFQLSILHQNYENGETYDLNTINIFKHLYSADKEIEKYALTVTVHWLGQFFYYSRSFSGLNDWGEIILDEVMMFVDNENLETAEFAFLLSNLFSWCEFNNAVNEIEFLKRKYTKLESKISEKSNELFTESIRTNIILSNRFSSEYRKEIAQKLKSHSWENDISETQFYIITYVNNLLPEISFQDVKNAVISLQKNTKQDNRTSELHEKSRIAKILNPFIRYCFDEVKYDELHQLISTFYDRSEFKESVLFVVPNSQTGTRLLNSNQLFNINHNPYESIVELTKFRNLALNQFVLIKGLSYTNPMPKGELGKPNLTYGKEFEKSLLEIYNLKEIESSYFSSNLSFFQFDFNGLPIQSLFLKQLKLSLPKQISFREKVKFDSIKKILFWTGNSFTSILEFECVKAICESRGIYIKNITSSKEELLSEINGDYDILWISSHGEHVHYDPFNSKIVLDDESFIELNEVDSFKNPNKEKRRLFFANVCEGGITAQTGDLINVGFPALMTDSNQDFLSHLWMVQTQIAQIYGVLFIMFISNGHNPYEAFERTVLTLIEGKESVTEKMSEFKNIDEIADLIQTITNLESLDFSNILNWGSSAYYV